MRKILFIMVLTFTIVGGILVSFYMMEKNSKNEHEEYFENKEIAEKVLDECIDEYKELEIGQIEVEEVNSEENEKVSPGAIITYEKYYKDCEHITNRYEEIPKNLVNATKEDIEREYSSWKLKEFSKEKIVLYQEINGTCGEHYMIRDVDGKINIYKLDENGNESLLNETDIATKYLTETDMIDMEKGLIVYGKENLNKLLEDFE